MSSVLSELQTAVAEVAERVGPSVVGLGRGWGRGSGVVIAPGRVLTNAHNLRGEEVTVVRADGERTGARVSATDLDLDLAVLDLDTGEAPAVEWPEDDAVPALGTPVVALADPGGRGLRAALGFVTVAGRRFRGPRGRRVEGAIEHSAPLPRGSSGGPLVDADGRLLGINSIRLEGGLILALPATAKVRDRLLGLAGGDSAGPPRLGVAVAPPRVARRMRRAVGLPEHAGLLVRGVEGGSPAERAGIQKGDLLAAAAGRELDGIDGLYAALDSLSGDGSLTLTVVRGTEDREVQVSFGP
ncbi:MAG TPA: S1C family serine protease [Thermoleophilaceae bacterium]|nr:S1C family serine protease [Thermoleophilaceae bacterium]